MRHFDWNSSKCEFLAFFSQFRPFGERKSRLAETRRKEVAVVGKLIEPRGKKVADGIKLTEVGGNMSKPLAVIHALLKSTHVGACDSCNNSTFYSKTVSSLHTITRARCPATSVILGDARAD